MADFVDLKNIVVGTRHRDLSQHHVDALATDIAANGLISPITLWLRRDGTVQLVAGEHRLEALRRLGLTTLTRGVHYTWMDVEGLSDGMAELKAQIVERTENVLRNNLDYLAEKIALHEIRVAVSKQMQLEADERREREAAQAAEELARAKAAEKAAREAEKAAKEAEKAAREAEERRAAEAARIEAEKARRRAERERKEAETAAQRKADTLRKAGERSDKVSPTGYTSSGLPRLQDRKGNPVAFAKGSREKAASLAGRSVSDVARASGYAMAIPEDVARLLSQKVYGAMSKAETEAFLRLQREYPEYTETYLARLRDPAQVKVAMPSTELSELVKADRERERDAEKERERKDRALWYAARLTQLRQAGAVVHELMYELKRAPGDGAASTVNVAPRYPELERVAGMIDDVATRLESERATHRPAKRDGREGKYKPVSPKESAERAAEKERQARNATA